ncbi:GntR family transcriptional regulator [Rhodococcus sp. NPDC049939]|uniref:GntR family transcriptional regulator n=1 Tax=Rhodococcus sp. NPDC049939 TaxID=3155511 RepID=UPI0033E5B193
MTVESNRDAVSNPAALQLSPAESVTRRDAVIDQIKRGIVLGTIKPGEKLTESALSTALGVSRPTVREALNQVAQEGLLIHEPYRRLRVADLDAAAVLDMADVRVALDMQAATDIIADTSGSRMKAIDAVWEVYERNALAEDFLVQHESHLAFHRGIWAASGNSFLMRLWPVTAAHMTIALARDQATRQDPQRAYEMHLNLIEAIHSRDLECIHTALVEHTVDSARELVALMSDGSTDRPIRF